MIYWCNLIIFLWCKLTSYLIAKPIKCFENDHKKLHSFSTSPKRTLLNSLTEPTCTKDKLDVYFFVYKVHIGITWSMLPYNLIYKYHSCNQYSLKITLFVSHLNTLSQHEFKWFPTISIIKTVQCHYNHFSPKNSQKTSHRVFVSSYLTYILQMSLQWYM